MSREVHVYARLSAFAWAAGHSPAREIVQLRVPQQQLNCTQVFCFLVNQCCFGSAHRMCAIDGGIKTNFCDPSMNDPSVLPS